VNVPFITYDRTRLAASLLDACIAWEKICAPQAEPKTIDEYLPRLQWVYDGIVPRQGPTWHLELDGVDIAWYAGPKQWRPAITAELNPAHCNPIPVDVEYVTPAEKGM
jgi:hypothetical protein